MKNTQRVGKSLLAASICTAIALGAVGLTPQRAEARRPGPLCGPSYLWVCHLPDGSTTYFGGTICDKYQYEQQTGATCAPAPF
jgi:hypothetical protein